MAEGRTVRTRTPLRISLAGGGSDFAAFYSREPGAVVSTTIDKFVDVSVTAGGDRCEMGELVRACVAAVPVDFSVDVRARCDLPTGGGLGSSSAYVVGLLLALHALRGERPGPADLAEEAAAVEIGRLGQPIGKQDHYAAAFGGLNFYRFLPDGRVEVEPQRTEPGALDRIFSNTLLFWTGIQRLSADILAEQQERTEINRARLSRLGRQASQLHAMLSNGFQARDVGRFLDEGWHLKRGLAPRISNASIDSWYARAMGAGALGGKLCGAGGGGFLLFVAPADRHDAVRQALAGLEEVRFGYEPRGARVE
jgi:D-glycero-alpha-D-manno-heptose-7-phosphate kinase